MTDSSWCEAKFLSARELRGDRMRKQWRDRMGPHDVNTAKRAKAKAARKARRKQRKI